MKSGDIFGGCRIVSECGTGGYGTVYLAIDALGRRVALKVFHSNWNVSDKLDGLRKYMDNAENNPGLIKIYHFGVEDSQFFYIMEAADNAGGEDEYIPDTLGWRLEQCKSLALDEAMRICQSLLDALEKLHGIGMVHRDLKPDNVIFVNGQPKLGDLDFISEFNHTMSLAGTLGFIPPEFFTSSIPKSVATDLYALGKILYCSVTGNPAEAYPAIPQGMALDAMYELCVPLTKLCSKNASQRPKSCDEFRKILNKGSLEASQLGRMRKLWLRIQVIPLYRNCVNALLLVLLLLAAVGVWLGLRHKEAVLAERTVIVETAKDELADMVSDYAYIKRDLELSSSGKIDLLLEEAENLRTWEDLESLRECVAEVREIIQSDAKVKYSAIRRRCETGTATFASVEDGLAFLHSPLARCGLDAEAWTSMRETLLAQDKGLLPVRAPHSGKNFSVNEGAYLNFHYVPKGGAAYSYWMMCSEMSSFQFEAFAGYARLTGRDNRVICVSKNDALHCAKKMYEYMKEQFALPPGYIVRPPTEQEANCYLAFRKCGGLDKDFKRDVPMVENWDFATVGNVSPWQFGVYKVKEGIATWIKADADLQNAQDYSIRFVIAPGDISYYDNAFCLGLETVPQEWNGAYYVKVLTHYATVNFEVAQDLAATIGAQVPEPESLEELRELGRHFGCPDFYPYVLGAENSDGKWHWLSSNKEIHLEGLPQNCDEGKTSLIWNGVVLENVKPDYRCPILLLKWRDKSAFEHRSDLLAKGKGPLVIDKFQLGGREYLLVKSPFPLYASESFFNMLGYRLAVLKDETVRRALLDRYSDKEMFIGVGAVRFYDVWRWGDGSLEQIEGAIDRKQLNVAYVSPMMIGLSINAGIFKGASRVSHLLLEAIEQEP